MSWKLQVFLDDEYTGVIEEDQKSETHAMKRAENILKMGAGVVTPHGVTKMWGPHKIERVIYWEETEEDEPIQEET